MICSTLKRDRDGEFPEIEETLFRWIRQANAMKLAINGNILKEKAILLALKMGQDNFEASNGWLEKFKARRNIAFKQLHGEAGSVDANSVATWKGFVMDKAMEEVVEEEMNRCFEALKKHQAIVVNYIDFLEVDKDVQVAGEQSIEEIVKEDLEADIFTKDLSRDQIKKHLENLSIVGVKTKIISRRLVANGLHSCRPLRRLPLTPPNRRQRLEWCRARSTWMTEWHRVVFSDESRFCLSSDSRRVRVWRRRGERSNPAAIVERPTVRQRGIMVWGAIAYDSRSPLLPIQGTMTAQRYVDDVLRPVTLPYLQGVPNALYQQDNARPHTARISQQALQDVQMLPWPPYSPDLSPIEHVWDIIGRRLHALPQPRSEDELWQMVEREWRAIPQDAIRTLIDSLPRRVAACIAVRGGPTCY
ncbi:Transposase [Cordylochernes scorpioides]|uniref:Transposase n=1 Tax=Cordylochernes scorpioides TaxID=51811 RepID=A0ABY6LR26_9ARAC|nr:Transposase [Cordylochernes scorpioides]